MEKIRANGEKHEPIDKSFTQVKIPELELGDKSLMQVYAGLLVHAESPGQKERANGQKLYAWSPCAMINPD